MVGIIVGGGARSVRRRSSTESLRRAVNDGVLSVKAADDVLNDAHRRFTAGSNEARRAVDDAVAAARSTRKARAKPSRALPDVDPYLEAARRDSQQFLEETRARLFAWAVANMGPGGEARDWWQQETVHNIVGDFIADIHMDVLDLKRRLHRLGSTPIFQKRLPADPYGDINRLLREFAIPPVRRGDEIDVDAIKKAYKRLARETHPDINRSNPAAKEQFQRLSANYERPMDLIEALQSR